MRKPSELIEFSGKKFLLFILFPSLLVFMVVFILFAPDEPIGGESTFYPREDPFARRQQVVMPEQEVDAAMARAASAEEEEASEDEEPAQPE